MRVSDEEQVAFLTRLSRSIDSVLRDAAYAALTKAALGYRQEEALLAKVRLPPGPRDWKAHPWSHGWVWHGPTAVGTAVDHKSFGKGKVVGSTKTRVQVAFPDGKTRSFPHAAGLEGKSPPAKPAKPSASDHGLTWQIHDNKTWNVRNHESPAGYVTEFLPDKEHSASRFRAYRKNMGGTESFATLDEAKAYIAAKEATPKTSPTDTGGRIGREDAGRVMYGDRGYEARTGAPRKNTGGNPKTTKPKQIKFNEKKAATFHPVKQTKHAEIIRAKPGEKTTITTPWGEQQHFVGPWVKVPEPGEPGKFYGSALAEWKDMHTRVPGTKNGWQKTATVDAYQHTGKPTSHATVLADGTVETTNTVNPGDWIVRQKNGEIQIVKDEKFRKLYDIPSAPKRRRTQS